MDLLCFQSYWNKTYNKFHTLSLGLRETTLCKYYYSVYWTSVSWWSASHCSLEKTLRSELNWIINIKFRISTLHSKLEGTVIVDLKTKWEPQRRIHVTWGWCFSLQQVNAQIGMKKPRSSQLYRQQILELLLIQTLICIIKWHSRPDYLVVKFLDSWFLILQGNLISKTFHTSLTSQTFDTRSLHTRSSHPRDCRYYSHVAQEGLNTLPFWLSYSQPTVFL